MRTTIYSMLLLAVVVLTMGNTSAGTNNKMKSLLQNLSSYINLYEEFVKYIGAVMSKGIPALNVPPKDPLFLNGTVELHRQSDPNFPNYTNINVQADAVNITGFSDFEVRWADLSLAGMLANLELYQDFIGIQIYNVVTSVVDTDGTLLQYSCSNVYAGIVQGDFTSQKELELKDTYLQVKRFKLDYSADGVGASIYLADCTGDEDLAFCMLDQIVDVLAEIAFVDMPEYLKAESQNMTIILNDIFALRNVTDEVGNINKVHEHAKTQLDYMNEVTDSGISTEAMRRSTKKASHQKKDNSFTMKWGM